MSKMKRRGLTAGSGMVLGIVFGAVFGHVALGMIIGMLVGAAAAGARRRAPLNEQLGLASARDPGKTDGL
jgi:F0F1-type ATP synthase assembly protein I